MGTFRDDAGRLMAAMLAIVLTLQVAIAGFLSASPQIVSAYGDTVVICGVNGLYSVTLDSEGDGKTAPIGGGASCPFCLAGPATTTPAAPECAPPRRIVAARLVAPEGRAPSPRRGYVSPPSRAPPRIL